MGTIFCYRCHMKTSFSENHTLLHPRLSRGKRRPAQPRTKVFSVIQANVRHESCMHQSGSIAEVCPRTTVRVWASRFGCGDSWNTKRQAVVDEGSVGPVGSVGVNRAIRTVRGSTSISLETKQPLLRFFHRPQRNTSPHVVKSRLHNVLPLGLGVVSGTSTESVAPSPCEGIAGLIGS